MASRRVNRTQWMQPVQARPSDTPVAGTSGGCTIEQIDRHRPPLARRAPDSPPAELPVPRVPARQARHEGPPGTPALMYGTRCTASAACGGEGGIRTHGPCGQRFSRPPQSATLPPLRRSIPDGRLSGARRPLSPPIVQGAEGSRRISGSVSAVTSLSRQSPTNVSRPQITVPARGAPERRGDGHAGETG